MANHAEQGVRLFDPVYAPIRIEYLVPTVLGVGLGEHHQFHIAGVAPQLHETGHQVVDLIIRQGQAQGAIRRYQRFTTARQHIHSGHGPRCGVLEQLLRRGQISQHRLRHAIVHQGRDRVTPGLLQPAGQREVPGNTPLQALDLVQAAVVRNIGGLAGPGRYGAGAGHHQQ